MKNIKKTIVPAVIAAICAFLLTPAVHAGLFDAYAKFKKDPEIRDTFRETKALPNLNYFYTGRSNLPYAVIGIDPKYVLESRFWNKIETRDMVIDKVDHLMPVPPFNMAASIILDANGNQIGIWFSYYTSTIVKFGKDHTLTIYSPYTPNRWEN